MDGNFTKWGFHEKEYGELRVVLFVSRNKDNKDIDGFKERRKAFVTNKNINDVALSLDFTAFVNAGATGEVSRMYMSVNARDEKRVRKALLMELIDKEDFSVSSIPSLTASVAARKENALTKHWLLDFDNKDSHLSSEFINELHKFEEFNESSNKILTVRSTPNGCGIVIDHGFDTRKLLDSYSDIACVKWSDIVTVKRDDLLCVDWRVKI